MSSWLVRQSSKVLHKALPLPLGHSGVSPFVFFSTSRCISNTYPTPPAVPYSRVNFSRPTSFGVARSARPTDETGAGGFKWNGVMESVPSIGDGSASELWLARHVARINMQMEPHHTYTGRSIGVQGHQDSGVADACTKLGKALGRNNVFAEFRRNQRHENKGAQRRRLESVRWRRRFAHEVRTKVQLVNAIRRRGA